MPRIQTLAMAAAVKPVNATIAPRPTLRRANDSNSSSVNVVNAFVTLYVANKVVPNPRSENGGYVICSITFKPVNPQFKSPSDDPYMAARPFTASMNGKFGPGGGSSEADAECLNFLRFGLIGKNCNREFNVLLFILF